MERFMIEPRSNAGLSLSGVMVGHAPCLDDLRETDSLPCGWEALANAIIGQAATDYRLALRRLQRYPNGFASRGRVIALERFFHSDWCAMLSNADPDYLIQKLREEPIS